MHWSFFRRRIVRKVNLAGAQSAYKAPNIFGNILMHRLPRICSSRPLLYPRLRCTCGSRSFLCPRLRLICRSQIIAAAAFAQRLSNQILAAFAIWPALVWHPVFSLVPRSKHIRSRLPLPIYRPDIRVRYHGSLSLFEINHAVQQGDLNHCAHAQLQT